MGAQRPPSLADARCISAGDAAAYCGLTSSGFRSWVDRGILPDALPGTGRWDRHAIDAALDRISGLAKDEPEAEESEFDRWKRGREARRGQG